MNEGEAAAKKAIVQKSMQPTADFKYIKKVRGFDKVTRSDPDLQLQ